MPDDGYKPDRFLGIPQRRNPHSGQGEEPRRMMGLPLELFDETGPAKFRGLFGDIRPAKFRALVHPIREYQRWLRRRRLGPYAIDDDERRPYPPDPPAQGR
jgi:hypothetical protein